MGKDVVDDAGYPVDRAALLSFGAVCEKLSMSRQKINKLMKLDWVNFPSPLYAPGSNRAFWRAQDIQTWIQYDLEAMQDRLKEDRQKYLEAMKTRALKAGEARRLKNQGDNHGIQ